MSIQQDAQRALEAAEQELADSERLLKIAQVARMANVSLSTFYRDMRAGRVRVERQPVGQRHRTRVRLAEARRYAYWLANPLPVALNNTAR